MRSLNTSQDNCPEEGQDELGDYLEILRPNETRFKVDFDTKKQLFCFFFSIY